TSSRPSPVIGSPLVHHWHARLYTTPQASFILEHESIRQQPTRALSSSWHYWIKSLQSNRRSFARVERPCQPAKVYQPDGQKQEREPQPQTAALPGGSSATDPFNHRLVSTTVSLLGIGGLRTE